MPPKVKLPNTNARNVSPGGEVRAPKSNVPNVPHSTCDARGVVRRVARGAWMRVCVVWIGFKSPAAREIHNVTIPFVLCVLCVVCACALIM